MPLSQALVGDVLARAVIALRERRRREALAQTEKLRALGQMASGVAHDLNQYLGLVAGHSELALRALGDPTPDLAAAADDLRIVIKAAMDGAATVRRLQTFARPTQTRPAEPFELGTLLRDVARLTAPQWRDAAQAQGRPIVVVCDVEDAITIEGWPDSLGEALTNLVFNAIDALPNGGTIHLAARRSGSPAVVEVADSGIGMGADVQAHLFEPYFTTKGERGTGLGLSLVYGIVERHGGEIAVDSAPGRGTIFRLLLPLAQAEPAPAAEPPAQRAPAPAARASPRRILAVDDDAGLLRLVVEMLRVDGHQVTAAASGAEALERLAAEPFDLMITDLGMPGLSGWELADTVRNRYPDLPVVLATGWGAAIDQEEAEAHGVRAVLAKPYRLTDLQRVVATCATLPANSLSNDHPE
jgi:CheY-like chemotaxis protein/nitrogen-specific signal transduction histidine kinase